MEKINGCAEKKDRSGICHTKKDNLLRRSDPRYLACRNHDAITLLHNHWRLLVGLHVRMICDYGRVQAIGSMQPLMRFGNLLPMIDASYDNNLAKTTRDSGRPNDFRIDCS
jgi:hypothetical protein